MRRHHTHEFTYDSDRMAELQGSDYVVKVQVEVDFDLDTGPIYDSPFGPLGRGAVIENEIITGLWLENGKSIKHLLPYDQELNRELKKAVESQHYKMYEADA